MKILSLDTSTQLCSVAVVDNGRLVAMQQSSESFAHNGLLFEMLEKVLAETGLTLQNIDALAVGQGPGSFTGLRIGVSAWKAIAFASGLPLLPVCPLKALAFEIYKKNPVHLKIRVFMDARQSDAFTALYDFSSGTPQIAESIRVVNHTDISQFNDYSLACGNLSADLFGTSEYLPGSFPTAQAIGILAESDKSLQTADQFFEPSYYKEFKIHRK